VITVPIFFTILYDKDILSCVFTWCFKRKLPTDPDKIILLAFGSVGMVFTVLDIHG